MDDGGVSSNPPSLPPPPTPGYNGSGAYAHLPKRPPFKTCGLARPSPRVMPLAKIGDEVRRLQEWPMVAGKPQEEAMQVGVAS